MKQRRIPAVYVRGGTSRALVFKTTDLPSDAAARDAILLAAIGSPDPNRRQLNGLGGGVSSLSKIAIVGPSTRPDADVDYTFGQVAIDAPLVQYKGNCGNISAAIGPYAVEAGLVEVRGERARVRIHNTNTGKIIVSEFALLDGVPDVDGDFELDGVAGSWAPVRLSFLAPGGAATGKLLPTGRVRDTLDVPGLGEVEVSLVDASNPVVFVRASAFGLDGTEMPDALDARPDLLARFEDVRVAAALAMGLTSDPTVARHGIRNLPQVALVASPIESRTLAGKTIAARDVDILVRMISAGQPHRATPLTGGMCVACAMRLPGSLAAAAMQPRRPHNDSQDDAQNDPHAGDDDLLIAHPSGVLRVAARVRDDAGRPYVESTAVYRSARRLMEGNVLVPESRLTPSTGSAAETAGTAGAAGARAKASGQA
ncbi:2-methylaconitate cis-trans isomerase PrpF family protein [Chitinasiproducens palmae]|uniref:PrpF family protein n=1 Tax=Chitinasiproducens palmae TaxID=1770053 RepID=A0A1H2PPN3_9BURK|nr:PrpF domain-containing protein [Chitinasiproducens palmae]SDV48729.1 hypothetical protein SAMN05216551_10619 [Chitinasiproducens palmae]